MIARPGREAEQRDEQEELDRAQAERLAVAEVDRDLLRQRRVQDRTSPAASAPRRIARGRRGSELMREVGHFRQPHPEPAEVVADLLQLAARDQPVADVELDRVVDGRIRASAPSSRRSSTSSLTSGRALPTEIVTSIGTPRKAPARAWRGRAAVAAARLGVRRGLVIRIAWGHRPRPCCRFEMRRDAGADLRDAGVEIEMVVALVPEDLRLARQELRRRLDDGVEAQLRQHRAERARRPPARSAAAARASGAWTSARSTIRAISAPSPASASTGATAAASASTIGARLAATWRRAASLVRRASSIASTSSVVSRPCSSRKPSVAAACPSR